MKNQLETTELSGAIETHDEAPMNKPIQIYKTIWNKSELIQAIKLRGLESIIKDAQDMAEETIRTIWQHHGLDN